MTRFFTWTSLLVFSIIIASCTNEEENEVNADFHRKTVASVETKEKALLINSLNLLLNCENNLAVTNETDVLQVDEIEFIEKTISPLNLAYSKYPIDSICAKNKRFLKSKVSDIQLGKRRKEIFRKALQTISNNGGSKIKADLIHFKKEIDNFYKENNIINVSTQTRGFFYKVDLLVDGIFYEYNCHEDQYLLDGAETFGIDVLWCSSRAGGDDLSISFLIRGLVEMEAIWYIISEDDFRDGWFLHDVTYPRSDIMFEGNVCNDYFFSH